MPAQNIYYINDMAQKTPAQVPLNRMIFSSFKTFETERESFGFSIKAPLKGRERYIVGKKAYSVGPGEYFLAGHGQLVGYDLKHKSAIDGFCVYLDELLVRKALSSYLHKEERLLEGLDEVVKNELKQGKYMFEKDFFAIQMQALAKYRDEEISSEELNQLFYALSLETGRIMHQHHQRKGRLSSRKKCTREEIYLRLQTAKEFLHAQLHLPLNIQEVAKHASFSEFHFIRCFTSCFGSSPYQYLTQLRVEKAKELIVNQNYPLAEVAAICGFSDECTFSKVFKKQAGIPPGMYRKLHTKHLYVVAKPLHTQVFS
ncbi:AraC family transcriptional regulator [Flammeovirgaceae bacterium 311]|nr:AraC family transcriptional regulator [Flammeovirgaceae bacterium 311]